MPLGWGLFTLSWLLPNHYNPWLSFHSEALAFASLAIVLAGMLATLGRSQLSMPWVALFTLCVAAIPWLQWFFGISYFAGDALLASGYLSGWAAAMVIGFHLAKSDGGNGVDALMHMLWIAALCSAFLGLVQWLRLETHLGIFAAQMDDGDPAMGNLAQPNQLSTLLVMGMLAYCYVFERRIIGVPALALGISVMTFVLVLTHSRAGMLGFLVAAGFLLLKQLQAPARLNPRLVVAWILLFGAMYFASPFIDKALLIDYAPEPLFTVNGRVNIWLQAWEGIKQAPWTGYGWDHTFSATSAGAIRYPGQLVATYAHNAFVDVVAWNGIPLGLALVGLGGYWFCTRLYRASSTRGTFAMACLMPFAVHGMAEFSFAYAYFLLASGLLIGVVEASMPAANAVVVRRNIMAAALLVWAVVGVGIVYEYLLIEEDVRVTRFENLKVGATDPAYRAPTVHLLSQMATLQRATRIQPTRGMTAQQLDDMHRAVSRFNTGGLALRYATAQALNGDQAGALYSLQVIHGVYGPAFFTAAKTAWKDRLQMYPELAKIDIDGIQP